MEQTTQTKRFEEILDDAEEKFRVGLTTVSQWSEQARDLIKNKPGIAVSAVALAGFMTGLMLRQGSSIGSQRQSQRQTIEFSADPIIVFLSSAVAGLMLGPKILGELKK